MYTLSSLAIAPVPDSSSEGYKSYVNEALKLADQIKLERVRSQIVPGLACGALCLSVAACSAWLLCQQKATVRTFNDIKKMIVSGRQTRDIEFVFFNYIQLYSEQAIGSGVLSLLSYLFGLSGLTNILGSWIDCCRIFGKPARNINDLEFQLNDVVAKLKGMPLSYTERAYFEEHLDPSMNYPLHH